MAIAAASMTHSRRSVLRGFLALPVAARLAPKPLPMWPVNGAKFNVGNPVGQAATLPRTWADGATVKWFAMPPGEWERALAKLAADNGLSHVDIEGGGVICRGV